MEVVPKRKTGIEVMEDLGVDLVCSSCSSQRTSDKEDTGWVECPLKEKSDKFICLGCCIDLASICRSQDYQNHPYIDDLKKIADGENIKLEDARNICLKHQSEILRELTQSCPNEEQKGLLNYIEYLRK